MVSCKLLAICLFLILSQPICAESKVFNLKKMPSSVWVEVSRKKIPLKTFHSVKYLSATDEFMIWGKDIGWGWEGPHGVQSSRYDVETLKISDKNPVWNDSFPFGKEKNWANAKFPDWSCKSHRVSGKINRPWRKDVHDFFVGGMSAVNQVSFTETEGIARPTRAAVFHHVCVDTIRNRVLYFVGGCTFVYDPVKRIWTDLKAKAPVACKNLVWASIVYDPIGDKAILFGGGMALNPWGGARTWVFDCKTNKWSRAKIKDGLEPPLRGNAQMVYDEKNKLVVLFGGDSQVKHLADTWALDPASMSWQERKPKTAPYPDSHYAATYLKKQGLILYVFPNYSNQDGQGIWTYDVSLNQWSPRKGKLPRKTMKWISCDYSPKDDLILLSVWKQGTYAYKLEDKVIDKNSKRKTAPPSRYVSIYKNQQDSFLDIPTPDKDKIADRLKNLPVNVVVDSKYPGFLKNKTWSGATIDSDRGVVIFTGGGHSGYCGNDFAEYAVAENRWSFPWAPHFMPSYLWGTSVTVYGWSYGMRPQSQHSYRWYAYDPESKMVVYCPRLMANMQGKEMILDEKTKKVIIYDIKKHGPLTWIYDSKRKKLFPPVFGRPFADLQGHRALIGTPKGIYARSGKFLYHGKITVKSEKAEVKWTLLEKGMPNVKVNKRYREYQSLAYDSKRKRLLTFAFSPEGDIKAFEHPLGKGVWKDLKCKGGKDFARDVIYDSVNDCLVCMPEEKILIMDCKTNVWKELDIEMPVAPNGYGVECALLYDPIHQLYVMMISEVKKGRKMGVYFIRFDPKTAKYK